MWERHWEKRPSPGLRELNINVARIGLMIETYLSGKDRTPELSGWMFWDRTVLNPVAAKEQDEIAQAWGDAYDVMSEGG